MVIAVREEVSAATAPSSAVALPKAATAALVPHFEALTGAHVAALDGVRGVAIALVLLFHVTRGAVTSAGWIGVDLFFVLSGFLITGILWDSRERRHRARTFYLRRALRILPLYYGVLLALFVAIPILHPVHTDEYRQLSSEQWWYWTYLQNWLVGLRHPIDGGPLGWFWSLAIEEQFYLVWPFLIWRASQQRIIRVCVATIVAGLLLRSALILWHPENQTSLFVYVVTPCRLDGLVVGSLIAIKMREPNGYSALCRSIRLPALASAIFLCVIGIFDVLKGRPALTLSPIVDTLGYPALAIAFGGLLVASLGPWAQVMSIRCFRWLGVYSYGLYVLHPFVVRVIRQRTSLALGTWQFAVIGTVVSLIAAWLSYHLYERQWLNLKNRLT